MPNTTLSYRVLKEPQRVSICGIYHLQVQSGRRSMHSLSTEIAVHCMMEAVFRSNFEVVIALLASKYHAGGNADGGDNEVVSVPEVSLADSLMARIKGSF